jgi:hypothetical protein
MLLHCDFADERDMRADAEDDARLKRQRHKLLLRLPLYDALSELRAAAQRMHPNFSYMGSTRPVVAVKLELACPEPVERKRHGVATIKVRTDAQGCMIACCVGLLVGGAVLPM